jgi:predicted DNA-binding transcriptional regulator YafY
MQYLLANLDSGGLLGPHLQPLLARLGHILGSADDSAGEVARRIRIQTVGARGFRLEHFQSVGSATLRRRRLLIDYHARGTDQTTCREVSPQRLIHYRDNWYLDAWCHLRNELRSFAVDAIRRAEILDTPARDIDDATLDRVLGAGYGIFSGAEVEWAVLRFSAERSRWVAAEKWHPDQHGRPLDDGGYELRLPYSQEPELLMDILRHGRHVEVLEPAHLREAVRREHEAAAQKSS